MNNWLAGTGGGLFQSDDGMAWSRVNACDYHITGMVRKANRVVVSCGNGLWEIASPSALWKQLHDETLTEVLDVTSMPGEPGVLVASAYGVATGHRRSNGAYRWTWHSDTLPANARFTSAIHAESAQHWIAGTEAGICFTPDAGRTWHMGSLSDVPIRSLCKIDNTYWAATDGRGVWTSPDARHWTRAGIGLDNTPTYAVAQAGNQILVATEHGVAMGDGIGPWEKMDLHKRVTALAAHPDDPAFWIAGCAPGGLWLTHDAGVSWRAVPHLPETIETILPPERAE